MPFDADRLKARKRPPGLPFKINKIGHIVLNTADMERAVRFYTEVLGFSVSDVYPESMVPGGMVFMRCNHDHHGVALVGIMKGKNPNNELNHLAFEVKSLDEVIRAREHLKKHKVQVDFEGRRRAGVQIAVEFRDPDNHRLEIYWGVDQVGAEGYVRPASEWKWAHSLEEAVNDPVRGQDTALYDPALTKRMKKAKPKKAPARAAVKAKLTQKRAKSSATRRKV
jgi:catechol 2,3-dioxygenase-like lactoylglutathione lyase family enzyme